MAVEKLIMDDMIQAKAWEQYLSEYVGSKMDWRKRANIIVVCASAIGIFLSSNASRFGEWAVYVTIAILLTTIALEIFSNIKVYIIMDDYGLNKLGELRVMYILYYNALEQLYLELKTNMIDQDQAIKQFYNIRNNVGEMEILKDKMNISIKSWIMKKVIKRVGAILKAKWED